MVLVFYFCEASYQKYSDLQHISQLLWLKSLKTVELGPLLRVSRSCSQEVGWAVFPSGARGLISNPHAWWQVSSLGLWDWGLFSYWLSARSCSQLPEDAHSSQRTCGPLAAWQLTSSCPVEECLPPERDQSLFKRFGTWLSQAHPG